MATLQVQDLGLGTYRLHTNDREIGWVSGAVMGFRGFHSARAAVREATAAYDALGEWLARQRRTEAAPRAPDVLRWQQRGELTELALGDVPIGWVVPMGGVDDGSTMEFAFALHLPAGIDSALTLSAARAVHAALDRRAAVRRLVGRRPTLIEPTAAD